MASNKDPNYAQQSNSHKEDDNMARQDSKVARPSSATLAQFESFGLKVCVINLNVSFYC